MYERNGARLAGRLLVAGLARLVVLVLAAPVLSIVWWEAGGRGVLAVVGGWLLLRAYLAGGRKFRELER